MRGWAWALGTRRRRGLDTLVLLVVSCLFAAYAFVSWDAFEPLRRKTRHRQQESDHVREPQPTLAERSMHAADSGWLGWFSASRPVGKPTTAPGHRLLRQVERGRFVAVLSDFEEWDHNVVSAVAGLGGLGGDEAQGPGRIRAGVDGVIVLAEHRVPYPPLYPPGTLPPRGVAVVMSRDNPGALSPPVVIVAHDARAPGVAAAAAPKHQATRSNAGGFVLSDTLDGADAILLTTDSSRVPLDAAVLHKARTRAVARQEIVIVVAHSDSNPVDHRPRCHNASFDVRRWTISLAPPKSVAACNYVEGGTDAVLVVPTQVLTRLGDWFLLRPLIEAVLIKALAVGVPVSAMPASGVLPAARPLYVTPHNADKRARAVATRRSELYRTLGVKLKRSEDGHAEWHGCNRQGPRCFGTVFNDRPDFLAAGRWTPPCCIAHLKETAQYVFDRLDAAGVRWWLEGGSLLGAARNGDLIPWDYDVDVGIRSEDIGKCAELALLDTVPHSTTAEGYIWEKAREGGFYRVQYSAYNHLHVDIFPFHLDGETIAKGSWTTGHKQDTSFPVKLLEPLTQLPFIGRTNASVPADYRAFLEYKFGKGVIESPMYPS